MRCWGFLILLGVSVAAFCLAAFTPLAFCGRLQFPLLVVDPGSSQGQAPEERGQSTDRSAPKKDYEDIEKQLKELTDELERLQKEASQKFRTELLPLIQKEIEKLKNWLRDLHLDKKGPETRET